MTAATASCSRADLVLICDMKTMRRGELNVLPATIETLKRDKYYMAYTESKDNQEETDYEI